MSSVTPPPPRKRGRPRAFDPALAIEAARPLFAARGYDRVSLNDLTGAMGINPPSFYAAFGCKALLFIRILDSHAQSWSADIARCFAAASPLAQTLAAILDQAVLRITAEDGSNSRQPGGCMLMEAGQNCSDAIVGEYIRKARLTLAATLSHHIARQAPERAAVLTDYMMTQLAGLSAMARDGASRARLQAVAQIASTAIAQLPC